MRESQRDKWRMSREEQGGSDAGIVALLRGVGLIGRGEMVGSDISGPSYCFAVG